MVRDSGSSAGRPFTRKQFIGRLLATSAALPAMPALLGASKPPSGRLTGTLNMYGIATVTPGHGLTKLLNEFLKMHPGLKINYQSFRSEQFVALFTAAQQSGQEIDVLMLNGQDVRRYATNGDLLPLDNIRYADRFQKLAIDTYTIRGHLWGVPLASTGGYSIMPNQSLLDKVGASDPRTFT